MCGFTLYINKKNKILDDKKINSILKIQDHRGPDFSKFIYKNNIYFFHNRLKIIDLSNKANQPMICKNSGDIILFNGEIYNFQEIKKKYLSNENFSSTSDTEVILKLYQKYGSDYFNELNGIFSFIIYDNNKKELISCRDRFGIKPLYYHENENELIFSTEIKPIIFILNKILYNFKLIKDYLNFGLLHHSNKTFFDKIFCHENATSKTYSLTKNSFYTKKIYWKLNKNKNLICKNINEYNEHYHYLFKQSLKYNLVSDVDIGLLLSSGVDSRYIYKVLDNEKINNLQSFTFGWNNKKYSESDLLKQNLKIPHNIFNEKIIKLDHFFSDLEKNDFL